MPELAVLVGALLLLAGAGGECQGLCQDRTQHREFSLSIIRGQILNRLGFQQAPNITGRPLPKIPPLEHLYDKFQGDQPPHRDDDEPDIKLEKIIAFGQQHQKIRHLRGKELLYFKFSENIFENRIMKAYLWLFARPSLKEDADPVQITVFKVSSEDPPTFSEVGEAKEARAWGTKGRWVSVDLKKLSFDWLKNPSDTISLAIHASIIGQNGQESSSMTQRLLVTNTRSEGSSLGSLEVLGVQDDQDTCAPITQVPFLELHVAKTNKPRTKRTIGLNCPENSEETRCCRYPLTVDFEEFGWDWIIAPKKYEANYCSGDCPYVFLQKYPHTHIVHLANPAGTAGPCCAPRKMSSISMLYFDQNFNIIYGLLPGMVVDRCGCS